MEAITGINSVLIAVLALWVFFLEKRVALIARDTSKLIDRAMGGNDLEYGIESEIEKFLKEAEEKLTGDMTEKEAQEFVDKALKDSGLSGRVKVIKTTKKGTK